MAPLKLIVIFMLQFEAGVSGEPTIYKVPGHDVTLPCASASSSDTTCSIFSWLYNRDRSQTFSEVVNGNVEKSSARAARLSLDTSCSLVLNDITAEDAGRYTCRQDTDQDVHIHLSVLTISPSPPDADPKRDGEVTLECSLLRYSGSCQQNSIRWVNETGTVLLGEGVGYKFLGQMNCVSVLTVKHQSGHNRRYSCQFVNMENNVEIEADYTPVFTDSRDWSPLNNFMLALRIAGLILMIVITVLVIRARGSTKPLDNENNVNNDADKVQYENVEAHPASTRLH
ncbi:uncharacterized protein LOC122863077 [Siniperca chuatsi]|uniref:uncharacterized protein LOC122863077 n=1 Tax=Siniperca chuatsi TaxID=119488 RepID=UPI001CE22FA7|nr:uncharacterized protein LOC122863077 [Siniperca chuatsi]